MQHIHDFEAVLAACLSIAFEQVCAEESGIELEVSGVRGGGSALDKDVERRLRQV
jgi:hypothetical protein